MMKKKKLVFIVGNPHTFNGFFKGQLKYFNKDFDIFGISSLGEWQKKTELNEGIKVYTVNIQREIAPFKDLISLFKLVKLLINIKPDAVHANTPKVGLISMIGSYIAGVKCRIYMCHGLRYQSTSGIMKVLLKNMERISCLLSTNVVCVSDSVKECLIKDKITNNKLSIIKNGSVNGLDDDYLDYVIPSKFKINLLKKLQIIDDPFIFTFVGRIVKDKGIFELLDAFEKVCMKYGNVKLFIVGDYDNSINIQDKNNIKRIVNRNKHVCVLGWKDDVRPYIALSDVLVQPSYREGLSTTLLEASALKVPAITTNVTGCKDVVKEGFNGTLISSPFDVSHDVFEHELFLSMEKFLLSSIEYRNKMGDNGNKFVKKSFYRKDIWEEARLFYKTII